MKHILSAAALAAAVLGFAGPAAAGETPAKLDGVKVISAEEAKKMLDRGVPVIDTRIAVEYAEKTVKGAQSVPYSRPSLSTSGTAR